MESDQGTSAESQWEKASAASMRTIVRTIIPVRAFPVAFELEAFVCVEFWRVGDALVEDLARSRTSMRRSVMDSDSSRRPLLVKVNGGLVRAMEAPESGVDNEASSRSPPAADGVVCAFAR